MSSSFNICKETKKDRNGLRFQFKSCCRFIFLLTFKINHLKISVEKYLKNIKFLCTT
jgi:hypothetical protein